VIRGNAGLLKCQWPSFVADHLTVESWLIDDKDVVTASHSQMHHGTFYKHLQKQLHLPPPPFFSRSYTHPLPLQDCRSINANRLEKQNETCARTLFNLGVEA